jgi:hypothetical protein
MRFSHHKLEFSGKEKVITCAICGKNWLYVQERGYSEPKQVYAAEKDS